MDKKSSSPLLSRRRVFAGAGTAGALAAAAVALPLAPREPADACQPPMRRQQTMPMGAIG